MALNRLAFASNLTTILTKINQSMVPAKLDDFLDDDYIFSNTVTSLIIFVYSVLAFTGTISNLCIIGVILMHPKLRTGSNLLVLNLNLSDLGVSLVVAPLTLVYVLRRNWTLGKVFCQMAATVQAIEIFVSALTISVIALDRMLRITNHHRLTSVTGSGTKSVLLATAGIWIVALLLSLPVALNCSVITIGDPEVFVLSKCVETWTRKSRAMYTIVTLISQLLVPTATLFICYLLISSYLKKQSGQVANASVTSSTTPRVVESETTNAQGITVRHEPIDNGCLPIPIPRLVRMVNDRNRKALLVLIAIWLSFTFTWLPWNLFNVYVDFASEMNLEPYVFNLLFIACHLVAISSPTSNAILYGWFNANIRIELVASMRKSAEPVIRLLAIRTSSDVTI